MGSQVSAVGDDALTLDMVHQYAYCPRRFHLMYVEGRWADNVFTVEGRSLHRRVDRLDHVLPDVEGSSQSSVVSGQLSQSGGSRATQGAAGDDGSAPGPQTENSQLKTDNSAADGGDEPPVVSRSVPLDSVRLGVSAKLDLVSTAGDEAVPVETKRGRVPGVPERCYEPERVQLMAQGLLLREHGYKCDHGVLYFAGSRTRVDVAFTPELEARTLDLIEQAHRAARAHDLPPPLDNSPKCNGCSLNGICLPDETLALNTLLAAGDGGRASCPSSSAAGPVLSAAEGTPAPQAGAAEVRRLYPARDDALPLYVQEQGASVGKTGETLVVRKGDQELARARLKDVSQLVLCGNISVTAQTVHLLCEAGIPIVHLSRGHWFYGVTQGITLRNAYDRAAQFRVAGEPDRVLAVAKAIVAAKGANQRTLLRRNAGAEVGPVLEDMAGLLTRIEAATGLDKLLGLEGSMAASYFSRFSAMLKPRDFDAQWDFSNRNRRPPRDPVNAMLSFAYALLSKECTVALLSEGLDPWWGFYHQPRHGRPALALDLMEEFRPLVADSAVITAINTGMVATRDFTRSAAACMLNDTGRKAAIRAFEARLDQLVTHPTFDYRCSWRAIIRLQARLLARWLRGDVPEYIGMVTR